VSSANTYNKNTTLHIICQEGGFYFNQVLMFSIFIRALERTTNFDPLTDGKAVLSLSELAAFDATGTTVF